MLGAIVLGGGRSLRMGADKLALRLDGDTLLARTCAAAATVAERVVVAGPEQPGLDVVFVREDPPFGGPAAGIAAALGWPAATGPTRCAVPSGRQATCTASPSGSWSGGSPWPTSLLLMP